MRQLMCAILTLFIILTLIVGCAKRKENLTPDDEKLVPVYANLLLMSEQIKVSTFQPDSAAYRKAVDSLLSNNGLTQEAFLNKLTVLSQSPLAYQQFNEKVRKELEHRKPR